VQQWFQGKDDLLSDFGKDIEIAPNPLRKKDGMPHPPSVSDKALDLLPHSGDELVLSKLTASADCELSDLRLAVVLLSSPVRALWVQLACPHFTKISQTELLDVPRFLISGSCEVPENLSRGVSSPNMGLALSGFHDIHCVATTVQNVSFCVGHRDLAGFRVGFLTRSIDCMHMVRRGCAKFPLL
jgi:hypothetical protein